RRLTDGFLAVLDREGLAPDVIAGTATAGIPHAAWLADRLGLPMVYVRASAKGHGRGNQIEGRLDEGARVVLVEDLVSTGGSSLASPSSRSPTTTPSSTWRGPRGAWTTTPSPRCGRGARTRKGGDRAIGSSGHRGIG